MKNPIIFFITTLFFSNVVIAGGEYSECRFVSGYTSKAEKVFGGEKEVTIKKKVLIAMEPAASWNQPYCWSPENTRFALDLRTCSLSRVQACGNMIKNHIAVKHPACWNRKQVAKPVSVPNVASADLMAMLSLPKPKIAFVPATESGKTRRAMISTVGSIATVWGGTVIHGEYAVKAAKARKPNQIHLNNSSSSESFSEGGNGGLGGQGGQGGLGGDGGEAIAIGVGGEGGTGGSVWIEQPPTPLLPPPSGGGGTSGGTLPPPSGGGGTSW